MSRIITIKKRVSILCTLLVLTSLSRVHSSLLRRQQYVRQLDSGSVKGKRSKTGAKKSMSTKEKKMKQTGGSKSMVSRKIMKNRSMSKILKIGGKSAAYPKDSYEDDDWNITSGDAISVTSPPDVDTSICANALEINPGEVADVSATFRLDPESVVDCAGGFELNNPFVEVLGVWFAVPGVGGTTTLKAGSCPALMSLYKGSECGSLGCADDASYNDFNCHVEWTSSEVGQVDYILVQNIAFNNTQGAVIPIQLMVEEVQQSTGGPVTITSSPTGRPTPFPTANPTTLIPTTAPNTNSEMLSPQTGLKFSDKDIAGCQRATEVSVGDDMPVELAVIGNTIGYCDGLGGGTAMGNMEVQVLSAYFKFLGTGDTIRASACPARVTVFSGDTCNNLTCTEMLNADFGCEKTWQSEAGRIDHILVQRVSNVNEDPEQLVPISLMIKSIVLGSDMPASPAATPTAAETPQSTAPVITATPSTPEPTETDGNTTTTQFSACRRARSLVPGETNVIANAKVLSGDVPACEGNFGLDGFEVPVLSAWFSVSGTGNVLKASACPHQLTVYTGTCSELQCVAGAMVNDFGCEVEWKSSDHQELDYLLVKTLGFEGGGGDYVLPVSISIEDPGLADV